MRGRIAAAALLLSLVVLPVHADPLRPLPPTNLQATYDAASNVVYLSWGPPLEAEGNVTYNVYRGSELIGTTADLTFNDLAVTLKPLTYSVTVQMGETESAPSNPAVVTPLVQELAPAGPSAAPASMFVLIILGQEMCDPLVLAGTPPQPGINWDCIIIPGGP